MKLYRTILTLFLCAVVAFNSPAQANTFAKKKDKKEKKEKGKKERKKDGDNEPEDLGLLPMEMPKAPEPAKRVMPLPELRAGGYLYHSGSFNMAGRRGIDISHYQHDVDWAQVATDEKVSFVIMKATEGVNFVDNKYQINLQGAQAMNIPVGAYHFFSPKTGATARLQFENFRRVVDPKTQDIIPVIDVEQRGSGSLSGFQSRLLELCKLIENEYGVKPIIYTGHYFYNKYLQGILDGYKVWMAHYVTDSSKVPDFDPNVRFVMWQHSDKGRIKGIKGDVDMNRFVGDYGLKDILLQYAH